MSDIAELGIRVDSQNVAAAEGDLKGLERQAARTERQTDGLSQGFNRTSNAASRADRQFRSMMATVRAVSAAFAALGGAIVVREFFQTADAATQLENRLRLVTDSTEELNKRQQTLLQLAEQTRSGLSSTTNLYVRLDQALQGTGRSTQEVLDVTKAFTTALTISGATQAEAAAATTQFSQAIAGSVVRAEEFNSLIDASPRLVRALRNQLEGINSQGALRQALEDGELFRDRVLDALLRELPTLQEELDKTKETGSDAFQQLGNDLVILVGNLDDAIGASEKLQFILGGFEGIIEDINSSFERTTGAAKLLELIEDAQQKLERLRGGAGLERTDDEIAKVEERLFNLREAYLAATAGANTTTEAQRAFEAATSDLVLDGLKPANDQTGNLAVNYNELRKRMEATTPALDAHGALLTGQSQAAQALNVNYEDLRRRMDAVNPAIEAHRRVLDGSANDANDATAATRDFGRELDRTGDRASDFEQSVTGAFREAGRSIQREFADILREGEFSFKSLGDIAARTASEIAAAFAFQRVLGPAVGEPKAVQL